MNLPKPTKQHTSTNMSSKQPQLPPILTIPTEIRLEIYALVLPHSLRLRFRPHRRTVQNGNRTWRPKANRPLTPLTKTPNHRISLLLTSRLLHRESAPLFYAANHFVLEVDQYSFTSVLRPHILGYMHDVEIKDLNLGRPSAWYRKRLQQVLGSEILVRAETGGSRMVFANLRRLTFQLEGTDAFADHAVQSVVQRVLWEAGRGRLEAVVVVGKGGSGRWRNVAGVVGRTLGERWGRGQEGVGDVVWLRGEWRARVNVWWVKAKSGEGGMVAEGLEGAVSDMQL